MSRQSKRRSGCWYLWVAPLGRRMPSSVITAILGVLLLTGLSFSPEGARAHTPEVTPATMEDIGIRLRVVLAPGSSSGSDACLSMIWDPDSTAFQVLGANLEVADTNGVMVSAPLAIKMSKHPRASSIAFVARKDVLSRTSVRVFAPGNRSFVVNVWAFWNAAQAKEDGQRGGP